MAGRIREWSAITAHLEKAGFYWVAPWVRGFGATRFLSSGTFEMAAGWPWRRMRSTSRMLWALRGFQSSAMIGARELRTPWPHCGRSALRALPLSLSYSPGGRFATPTFEQSQRWWYQWFMSTEPGAAAVRKIRSALPVINGHHGVHPAGSATLNSKRPRKASRIPIGPPSRSTLIGVAGRQSPRMSDTSH